MAFDRPDLHFGRDGSGLIIAAGLLEYSDMFIIEKLRSLLHQPFKIFWLCLVVGFVTLLYDGSFWNLWSLHHNYKEMEKRIHTINEETSNLNFKVQESNGREFIERQAMDQLGLVREEDLIFVFSD